MRPDVEEPYFLKGHQGSVGAQVLPEKRTYVGVKAAGGGFTEVGNGVGVVCRRMSIQRLALRWEWLTLRDGDTRIEPSAWYAFHFLSDNCDALLELSSCILLASFFVKPLAIFLHLFPTCSEFNVQEIVLLCCNDHDGDVGGIL